MTAERTQSLLDVVGAPSIIEPWLDRFYDSADADLVCAAAERPLKARNEGAAETDDGAPPAATDPPLTAHAAAHLPPGDVDDNVLTRAWRRGILDRRKDGSHIPASFHTRLEYWALFEGWQDIPAEVRAQVCAWESTYYADSLRERVAALKSGAGLKAGERGAEYLLLHEAEQLLRRAEHIYLWPCNCRAYVGACRKPALVCLRFENDRGTGWEVSVERAVEIMRGANRRGLMQVGEVPPGAGPVTAGALCNCCSDCCFEQRAGRELDAARIWPLSRYVAELPGDCSRCGRCARRCPFDAIAMSGAGRDEMLPDKPLRNEPPPNATHRAEGGVAGSAATTAATAATDTKATAARRPVLDSDRCRGCGLCATGCPDEALVMWPLTDPGGPERS